MKLDPAILGLGLLLGAALPAGASTIPDCVPPQEYTNRAALAEGDLLVALATDQRVYAVGQPVHWCLTVENAGPDSVIETIGFTPFHSLAVLPDTCTFPTQDCLSEGPHFFPEVVYFYGGAFILEPGGCQTWCETWDGTDDLTGEAVSGGFHLVGGVIRSVYPEVVYIVPAQGIHLDIEIGLSPALTTTWGRIKARYE